MSDNNRINDVSSMYEDWFLSYASYVILERAIPKIDDGFKPVQRRILHTLREMHDDRFHKVANVIGRTMQYHPHGDQAIGDALVKLGQKNLLINTQGNWGDVRSGDRAAAARYIEAKLSDFSIDVVFNKNITKYQVSYDGRNKEPISLPVKFPLILAQGAEGIAVGLSTKILPHNFVELIKASISIIKDKPFKIFPDFQTGGMIDVTNYNYGKKGGKIRIRSNIDVVDKKTLKITSLCYGITTTSLIDSIVKASNNSKIKIRNIEDNTSKNVEIIIHLTKGVSPNLAIDALYAFTQCEVSISPNCCVIVNNKPEFINVNDLLRISTRNTIKLLKQELEYTLNLLKDKKHFITLEKIFIENKIYRNIEDCETWESVLDVIRKSLNPFLQLLDRDIEEDDIIRLTEIKIKRISKYNKKKQDEELKKVSVDIDEVNNNISHINEYAIRYFEQLLKKYGEDRKRLTEMTLFDSISARRVIETNKKLYVDKINGFIGYNLKKNDFVGKCSDLDYAIVFTKDGKYVVTKIDDKKYIGKDIVHVDVWKKNNKHMIYNLAYLDGGTGYTYVKRFSITAVVNEKIYNLTQGSEGSEIKYFSANPNSESEIISIYLHSRVKVKNKVFQYDYKNLGIKSRTAKGNLLSKFSVRKIIQKSVGESTLGGLDIWLDESIGRLNGDKRGLFLGSFNSEDKIVVFYNDGTYEMTDFDFTNRYNMSDVKYVCKNDPDNIISVLYYNGKNKTYYVKRFLVETNLLNKRFGFISEERGSKLILLSANKNNSIRYNYRTKSNEKKSNIIELEEFISIKNYKAIGKRLDNKMRMSGFSLVASNDSVDNNDNDNDKELTLF